MLDEDRERERKKEETGNGKEEQQNQGRTYNKKEMGFQDEEKKKDREKMWSHSKNGVTMGVPMLLERRGEGTGPLHHHYYII